VIQNEMAAIILQKNRNEMILGDLLCQIEFLHQFIGSFSRASFIFPSYSIIFFSEFGRDLRQFVLPLIWNII
jgi:hypothetical protein